MSVPLAFPDVAGGLALLLRATLLMGAAWAAATALRKAGAPAAARHMAWLSESRRCWPCQYSGGWFGASLPILPAEALPAPVVGRNGPPFDSAGPISTGRAGPRLEHPAPDGLRPGLC